MIIKSLISIKNILSLNEIKRGKFILIIATVMAFVEMISLFSIYPFIAALESFDYVLNNKYLYDFYQSMQDHYQITQNSFIILMGIFSFIIITLTSIYKVFSFYFINDFIEGLRGSISARLFSYTIHKDYEDIKSASYSEISKTVLSEIDILVENVIKPVVRMLVYTVVAIVILAFIVVIDYEVAFILFFAFITIYLCIYLGVQKRIKITGENLARSNANRFNIVSFSLANLKQIKLSHLEDKYINNYKLDATKYSRSFSIYQTLTLVPNYIVEAVGFGVIILISILTLTKETSVESAQSIFGILAFISFASYRLRPAAQNIYQGISALRYGAKMLNFNSESKNFKAKNNKGKPENKHFNKFSDMIEFRNITKGFEKRQKIIHNFNAIISANALTCITGESGKGKSTLLDLIAGLLEPETGKILLDGVELTSENKESWQKMIAYVPQECVLYGGTIREELVRETNVSDEAALAEVIQQVGLAKDYAGALVYLERCVGDRGSSLSGGQKSRIVICQAILGKKKILLLDEPTSALDSTNAKLIIEMFKKLSKTVTIIVVTHDAKFFDSADQNIDLSQH